MQFLSGLLRFYWLSSWATQVVGNQHHQNPSNLTFAGVTFPNTPTVIATNAFIKRYLDPPTYNHVIRSVVYSLLIQSKLRHVFPHNVNDAEIDLEAITVAGLLHDMSWNPNNTLTKQFISDNKRFEVDGADTAREFLRNFTRTSPHGPKAGWTEHRLQLVWDAIALHGTVSIAAYKEPEVALLGAGILIDIINTPNVTFTGVPSAGIVTQEEYDRVRAEVPDLDLLGYAINIGIGLCISKPQTTWDNIISGFGEEFVEGYTLEGHRFVDILKAQR